MGLVQVDSLALPMWEMVGLSGLAGAAYLLVLVATKRALDPPSSSSSTMPVAAFGYLYGGPWLAGTVVALAFFQFGTILPVGLLLLDYLLFVAHPSAGDSSALAVQLLWWVYVPMLVVVAAVEWSSLLLVSGGSAGLAPVRDGAVVVLFGMLVGWGLVQALPVWRIVPWSYSLPIRIENEDDMAHRVDLTIIEARSEKPVYTETVSVAARETVVVNDAITRLDRYRIVGTLADDTTDEYVFVPRRRASVSGVTVWIEGELGHFAVIGFETGL